jgi:hypothetical protein
MFNSIPVVEYYPDYGPGQWGIQGSEMGLGFRNQSGAIALYVSTVHPLRNNNNLGVSPNAPMATLQAAVTRLVAMHALTPSLVGSKIIVGAGSALVENVTIPITAPKNCSILGMVAGGGGMSPTWAAATGAGTALNVCAEDWRISGFTFITPATGTSIQLTWTGATANGSGCMIDHNMFSTFQLANGRYAINFVGAPYNVSILDNEFSEIGNGGTAAAITCTDSATACPLQCRIERNLFRDVNNMIVSLGSIHGFGGSLIANNIFALSPQIATTLVIDLRGGNVGHNTVVGNYLGTSADYSQPGGYWDTAAHAGFWTGNYSLDVAEAEMSTAGITILPPAA